MFTQIRARNFKSWADTGLVDLSRISAFFGVNSSGKTSLIQTLLLMKQTTTSSDRRQVLNLGDDGSPLVLGLKDALFKQDVDLELYLQYAWSRPERAQKDSMPLAPPDPVNPEKTLFEARDISFSTSLGVIKNQLQVECLEYTASPTDVSISRVRGGRQRKIAEYRLAASVNGDANYLTRVPGRVWQLPPPVKCYGFPDEVFAYYKNSEFVSELELDLERQFTERLFYLGPLRQVPRRRYSWQGSTPSDVGVAGERAIEALLASSSRPQPRTNTRAFNKIGRAIRRITVEQHVAAWLAELDLLDKFDLEPIADGFDIYQVMVQRHAESSPVSLADVGFGVSQVLPVLVLLAYVPEGATVVLEQPELHLHPAVQAGLADIIIEASSVRRVQVIVESHSEHLLRRLQRRVAERKIEANDIALYFCDYQQGESRLDRLDLNLRGEISNWPAGFFGDPLGESVAMVNARRALSPREI